MTDQPVSREEYDALLRRVQTLEDQFDAHRTVIIAGLNRVERKLDDNVMPALTEQGTLLRAIARRIGIDPDE